MPDKFTHIFIGVVGAVAISLILKADIGIVFISALIGSVIPDILDPPIDYKHRKYFHSKRVLSYLLHFWFFFLLITIITDLWLVDVVLYGTTGYILHLLLDSTTPMGLPK